MIRVTYQKRNGKIIQRERKNYTSDKIGETTSMGWKVLDIKYRYKGNYYSQSEYDTLIDKAFKKRIKKLKFRQRFILLYKQLAYSLTLLILFKILEETMFYNFV